MDKITKDNSIKKLNAITGHIAFPDFASNDTELLSFYSEVYMTYSSIINSFAGRRAQMSITREINLALFAHFSDNSFH